MASKSNEVSLQIKSLLKTDTEWPLHKFQLPPSLTAQTQRSKS